MELKLFLSKVNNLWSENRLLKFVVIVLALLQVHGHFEREKAISAQRTIVIPPGGILGKMVFDGTSVDQTYLRLYGRYIADLGFSFTPATVERQFNELLMSVATDSYEHIKTILNKRKEVIERERITSIFRIQEMKFTQKKIIIEGLQQIGSAEPEPMAYEIGYLIRNGKFGLTGLGNAQ